MSEGSVRYCERQAFLRNPVTIAALVSTLVVVGGLLDGVARQQAWAWLLVLPTVGFAFVAFGRLSTHVSGGELEVAIAPVWTRRVPLGTIREAYVRTHRPVPRFGGWTGSAYSAFGNQAVAIRLTSGEEILLGSQRPQELRSALQGRLDQEPALGARLYL